MILIEGPALKALLSGAKTSYVVKVDDGGGETFGPLDEERSVGYYAGGVRPPVPGFYRLYEDRVCVTLGSGRFCDQYFRGPEGRIFRRAIDRSGPAYEIILTPSGG